MVHFGWLERRKLPVKAVLELPVGIEFELAFADFVVAVVITGVRQTPSH